VQSEPADSLCLRVEEPTALFINTGARLGPQLLDDAARCLRAHGIHLVHVAAHAQTAALIADLRAALDAGVRRVVVGGGDGTLSAAAAVLAGLEVRLGVLPLGTGNDFARSLRLPAGLREACEVIVHGRERSVDLGVANGRVFLNAASVGLSSAVTRRLSPALKRRFGRGAFALVAAGEAFHHRAFVARLEVDGEAHCLDAHQVVVGNGRYHGGGRLLSPLARHDDARLDVYVIRSVQPPDLSVGDVPAATRLTDLWALFRVGVLLGRGRHLEHPAVEHFRAREVTLSTEPPQEVDVDGELLGHTPVRFGVRPAQLRVLVPSGR
jgi:diacylglycerol kinase (ATP)